MIIVQVRSQSPVSPIEWDNVVLYGQYILDRKLVRQRRRAKRVVLSVLLVLCLSNNYTKISCGFLQPLFRFCASWGDFFQSLTAPFDLDQDVLGFCRPDKGRRLCIPFGDEVQDCLD